MDGCTLDTEGEQERVIKCLEAAIQRRVCEVSEISDKIFVLNSYHILINIVDFFYHSAVSTKKQYHLCLVQ